MKNLDVFSGPKTFFSEYEELTKKFKLIENDFYGYKKFFSRPTLLLLHKTNLQSNFAIRSLIVLHCYYKRTRKDKLISKSYLKNYF